jgi:hypothetical protein
VASDIHRVEVTNWPAVQAVGGSVKVNNFPATQEYWQLPDGICEEAGIPAACGR